MEGDHFDLQIAYLALNRSLVMGFQHVNFRLDVTKLLQFCCWRFRKKVIGSVAITSTSKLLQPGECRVNRSGISRACSFFRENF